VHIAERALVLCGHPSVPAAAGLSGMGARALAMLQRSLDALVQVREDLAREVCAADDEVDAQNRAILERVHEGIRANPDTVLVHLQVMHIARHLERIADHATNIAEDLIYLIEGEIVRHKPVAPPAG
jgi:phosphate transport system protein